MRRFLAIAGLALFGLCQPASAVVLYDNGPINGTVTAWTINFGFAVSDSFTLSQPSTVTGVNFGVWVSPGDTLNTVDYSITTAAGTFPGGTTESVTTGAACGPSCGFGGFYTVSEDSFSTTPTVLGPGTYYLVLQNAVTAGGNGAFWDQNSGPSTASENQIGTIPSESFQILGSVAPTPLPAALPLFATGLGGLGLLGWRRKRKAQAVAA